MLCHSSIIQRIFGMLPVMSVAQRHMLSKMVILVRRGTSQGDDVISNSANQTCVWHG